MLGESDNRGELKRPLRALWERYYCCEDPRVTFVRFARSGYESELNSEPFFSSAREGLPPLCHFPQEAILGVIRR